MTRIGNSVEFLGITADRTALEGQSGAFGSCDPDKKYVPNGQNAHCTVRSPDGQDRLIHGVAKHPTEVSYPLDLLIRTGPPRNLWALYGKRTLKNQTVEQWA